MKLVREFPKRKLEAQTEIKDTLGPDGMRKVLGIDTNLDPVALATVAAHLVGERYSRQEDRQALVRAAMLLYEAQRIAKEGPTIFDVPNGALTDLMQFWNHPAKWQLDPINQMVEPKKRLAARAKFITGQDRFDRAETDLLEALKEWAEERGESDIPAYKQLYKELLSSSDTDSEFVILLRDEFTEWKADSKSKKRASAAKKGRTLKSSA